MIYKQKVHFHYTNTTSPSPSPSLSFLTIAGAQLPTTTKPTIVPGPPPASCCCGCGCGCVCGCGWRTSHAVAGRQTPLAARGAPAQFSIIAGCKNQHRHSGHRTWSPTFQLFCRTSSEPHSEHQRALSHPSSPPLPSPATSLPRSNPAKRSHYSIKRCLIPCFHHPQSRLRQRMLDPGGPLQHEY